MEVVSNSNGPVLCLAECSYSEAVTGAWEAFNDKFAFGVDRKGTTIVIAISELWARVRIRKVDARKYG